MLDKVIASLEGQFAAVTAVRGLEHSYLAMSLVLGADYYTVDMSGYIKKILEGRKVRGVNSPATQGLCKDVKDSPLLSEKAKRFPFRCC